MIKNLLNRHIFKKNIYIFISYIYCYNHSLLSYRLKGHWVFKIDVTRALLWRNSEVTEVEGINTLSRAHKDSYDIWLEYCFFFFFILAQNIYDQALKSSFVSRWRNIEWSNREQGRRTKEFRCKYQVN